MAQYSTFKDCSLPTIDQVGGKGLSLIYEVLLESGGLLQHGASVAREMEKPCIVGIEDVTKILKDGQIVGLEGATGIIKKP